MKTFSLSCLIKEDFWLNWNWICVIAYCTDYDSFPWHVLYNSNQTTEEQNRMVHLPAEAKKKFNVFGHKHLYALHSIHIKYNASCWSRLLSRNFIHILGAGNHFFLFFFIVLQFILHIKSSSICMHCSSTRAYIQIWMNSFVCGCTKWLWALNVNINHYFYLIFITYFREKLILFTLQMAQSQTK